MIPLEIEILFGRSLAESPRLCNFLMQGIFQKLQLGDCIEDLPDVCKGSFAEIAAADVDGCLAFQAILRGDRRDDLIQCRIANLFPHDHSVRTE